MTPELILGSLVGIFLSIPVSIALLLALTRKPSADIEYVRVMQGEVVDNYPQLGEGER